MKTYAAGLQTSTQTSYANNGKTTLLGRAFQKTINSQSVIGPALTQFIDVQTTVGITPNLSYYNSTTQQLFVVSAASAAPTIALYNYNTNNGVYSYVGKITMSLGNAAATTHIFRGFNVYFAGGLMYVALSTTGSVVINGGTYVAWGLSASDFTVGGTTIFAASGSNQKAVYFLQDPSAQGVANVATTSWGIAVPQASSVGTINTKLWQLNGTVLLPVFYSWDLSGTPSVSGTVTNGVSAQTTLYAGTAPSAFFTMGASQNGYIPTNGEPVVLVNGTGNVPTAFTAWTPGTLQVAASNIYFMRDLQQVGGNWYFNLSTTAAGAAVTPTSATASFTMMRAYGTSTSLFNLKTGVLPALSGAILQSNSVGYCNPTVVPQNTALNAQDCISFPTTTTLYLGKITELTSGATTWPSLTPANITGTGIDVTTPVVALATYSSKIDRWVYSSNGSTYVVKPHQNSVISTVFGGTTDTYYETLNPPSIQAGATTITDLQVAGGWMFIASSAIGQRGMIALDLFSDALFGNSSVISPVLSVPSGTVFKAINTLEQLFDFTDSMTFSIRSATTSGDAIFSSATGGWTVINTAKDLSATAIGPFFQLMAQYQIATLDENTPAQLNDFLYTVVPPSEGSDNWAVDNDNTTQGTGSPSYVSFYMTKAYASGTVPQLFGRVIDTSGNQVFLNDTVTNPTTFQYSTNGGTSWTALGTIPNTVGTRVRMLVTPTPSAICAASIRES